jgi:ribonuclease R
MKKRKKDIHPITDDQVLRVLSRARRPVGIDELESIFRRGKPNRRELLKLLGTLITKGRVIELRNKRFGLTKEMDLVSGTLSCTRSGNGFVIPDSEGVKDIFVSSRNFNNAVHGDKVTVRLDHYARGKPEGKIIRITQRKSNKLIGFTKVSDNFLYVIPEDWRYNIEYKVVKSKADIGDGRLIVAEVTAFPGEKVEPECRITRVLRDLNSLNTSIRFPAGFQKPWNRRPGIV